ncbi:hypothetical protein PBAT_05445 [Paenibacillus antarcticus]|uniref:4,4'-diaponeurosporenoate glycosyltransferase n=2 Tax=Paenibacillus antarcticus TaxID=253703 RepID=A0A168QD88_9BACL|nr:hypothetical protein PBAT_05445 [Paenibacillus antarcticus]
MALMLKIIAIAVGCQLGFVIWNISKMPKIGQVNNNSKESIGSTLKDHSDSGMLPRVSILIPARNESHNIEGCLSSILRCDTFNMDVEVLILDDHSTDDTETKIRAMSELDGRVKLIKGKELPAGWMGKSFACHQLAQQAEGEWLLFIDADVRLKNNALNDVMKTAYLQGKGLITGFPFQKTGTWLEKLVVPMMAFTIGCHLPIPLIRYSKDPRFVAAHGAFMLIHHASYAASGGHVGIKDGLLDDMQLARAVKVAGHTVMLADVHEHAEMRMYESASEVWNGYHKNIYEGVGRNGFLLIAVLSFYNLFYVFPLMAILISMGMGNGILVMGAIGVTLLGMLVKGVTDRASGQSKWLCLCLPISILCLSAIALNSWKSGVTGKGYLWKGRWYG